MDVFETRASLKANGLSMIICHQTCRFMGVPFWTEPHDRRNVWCIYRCHKFMQLRSLWQPCFRSVDSISEHLLHLNLVGWMDFSIQHMTCGLLLNHDMCLSLYIFFIDISLSYVYIYIERERDVEACIAKGSGTINCILFSGDSYNIACGYQKHCMICSFVSWCSAG